MNETPDISYGLIHDVLYGHPAGTGTPKILKVVKKIADTTGNVLADYGPKVRRQIHIEGTKVGLTPSTYPYLYYLLDERENDWPVRDVDDLNDLRLIRVLLQDTGQMPPYKHLLQTPPIDQEVLVDEVLQALAEYGAKIAVGMLKVYHKILLKNFWAATVDPSIEGEDSLNRLVIKRVNANPGLYEYGLVTKAYFKAIF